jgi:manganese/zinc/iron transport system permease protein
MMQTINPYAGKNFGEFLLLFLQRMTDLIFGKLSIAELATDEVQVLVLGFVACASALVGVFLVLKKMTMLANSLSHTILLGIVVAYLIFLPFLSEQEANVHVLSMRTLLVASLATGLITAFLTQMLTQLLKLQEDASTGLVFTTLFALGIVLVTVFTRNTHLGTEAIMGNVDALHVHDLNLIFWVALIDLVVIVLFFKEFAVTTFDPLLAKSQGISSPFFNYLLMVLTSATVIGAFRAVGVLLVLAFLVGPALSARLLTHRLKKMIILAVILGVLAALISVALSRHLLSVYYISISTAGLTTTVIAAIYLLCLMRRYCYDRRLTLRQHK